MRKFHSCPAGVILMLIALAACSTGSGLRDITIDETNRGDIAAGLATELTVEEGRLTASYIARNHPELAEGSLPTGISLGEMIAAQRTYEKSRQAAKDASQDQEAESEPPRSKPPGEGRGGSEASRSEPPGESRGATGSSIAVPPRMVTLDPNSPLEIRLDEALSSKNATSGQRFVAHLDADLKIDDQLVAPRGSRIEGRVTDVAGSGRVKGRARMSLVLKKLWVDDTAYDLSTYALSFEAEKSTKDDAIKIGIGAAAGAVIGAIAGGGSGAAKGTAIGAGAGTGAVLLTKGEGVEFPAEQRFEFRLQQPLTMPVVM